MLALAVAFVWSLAATIQNPQEALQPPDPHRHLVPVHERPWRTDLAPLVRVVPTRSTDAGRDTAVSPDGRWRAFIVEVPIEPGGQIHLEEVGGRRRYVVTGIPLPYRPLSALVWLDPHLLAFDRWSQPHYGLHYLLDIRSRRLVLAVPFPDAFYLRQQQPTDSQPRP